MKFSWGSTSSLTYREHHHHHQPVDIMKHLENHPSTSLCFQVAIYLEILLSLLPCYFTQAHLPGSLGQVGRVNEVDTGFCGALCCLDVVARRANVVGSREVVSLSCLLPWGGVQRVFRAGCIVPVEVPKESVCSVGLRKRFVLGDLGNQFWRKPDVQSSVGSHWTHPSKLSVQLPLADMQCWMGK